MLQNILTQLLSNLVSPISRHAEHQAVADHFLDLYLSGEREADVVMCVGTYQCAVRTY